MLTPIATTRRVRIVAFGVVVSLGLLALFHMLDLTPSYTVRIRMPFKFHSIENLSKSEPIPSHSSSQPDSSKTSTSPRWPQAEECSVGTWQPRQPAFTSIEDFRAVYSLPNSSIWKVCEPNPNLAVQSWTEEERQQAGERRLMDVMGWTWVPDAGKMKDWDAEEFVVRLLRSPGGLIFIGDSITQQHYYALNYALNQANITFDANLPSLPHFDRENVNQHTLKKDNPITRRLLERAGVPASRLDRPITTMLEDDMLIHEQDIRAITGRLGAKKEYNWTMDVQRVEGWVEFVRNASRPRHGEENTITEDTVLLMNAGAHWSRHRLSMLPGRATDKDEQVRVKESFRQMIKLITTRLSRFPRLSVYYRSTSPGHPTCKGYTKPYPNTAVAHTAEQHTLAHLKDQGRARWDWDLFESHNELWKRTVGRLTREQAGAWRVWGSGKTRGARWFYLDLWDSALQRVDAHAAPGRDCLHWCMPSVFNLWSHQLFHVLFLETQSRLEKQGVNASSPT